MIESGQPRIKRKALTLMSIRGGLTIFVCFGLILGLCQKVCAGVATNAAASVPVIFIAPLAEDTNSGADTSLLGDWQKRRGLDIADLLIKALDVPAGKFHVLEAADTNDSDFTLRGVVTQCFTQTNSLDGGSVVPSSTANQSNLFSIFANAGAKRYKTIVAIEWSIVDTCTGKTIAADKADGSASSSALEGTTNDVAMGKTQVGSVSSVTNVLSFLRGPRGTGFADTALGKASAKAVAKIVKQLAELKLPESCRALQQAAGKVLAVPDKAIVIISLGSKEGWKVGDKLAVYKPVVYKDDKGAVVYTAQKEAGLVTLEDVQDDSSEAAFAGNTTPETGWIVKAK